MSRVGKYPVTIPAGVEVAIANNILTAKGKLGVLTLPLTDLVETTVADGRVTVTPKSKATPNRQMWGTTRALVQTMVQGVSTGFTRELDIVGIGYRCDMKGRVATFTLGYSHPIEFYLPDGIDLKIDKQTHLVLTGSDRQMLGQVAANMRALRPPDPYKNKGVRFTGEVLRKKVGKTGAGGK